jgi:hypothetical protein
MSYWAGPLWELPGCPLVPKIGSLVAPVGRQLILKRKKVYRQLGKQEIVEIERKKRAW